MEVPEILEIQERREVSASQEPRVLLVPPEIQVNQDNRVDLADPAHRDLRALRDRLEVPELKETVDRKDHLDLRDLRD